MFNPDHPSGGTSRLRESGRAGEPVIEPIRGHGAIGSLLPGCVATDVIRLTDVPVTLVK